MLEVVLALGAFIGALLIGSSILSIAPGSRHWRTAASADPRVGIDSIPHPRAFEPLHMEPFPLGWPSEVERASTAPKEIPWPSETWDDAFFGQRSREDVQRIARTAASLDVKRRHGQMAGPTGAVTLGGLDPAVEAERARARSDEKKRRATKKQEATKRAHALRPEVREAAPEPAVEAQSFVQWKDPTKSPPTAEEIGALVKQYGLAGAVEQIRTRTGWDFKEAAQYLADALRNR